MAGILILPGDESRFVINHDVGCKDISKGGAGLINRPRLLNSVFWMKRRHLNTAPEFVCQKPGHFPAGDQSRSFAVGPRSIQGPVTYAPDKQSPRTVIGITNLLSQHSRLSQIVSGSPTPGKEDDVVILKVKFLPLELKS